MKQARVLLSPVRDAKTIPSAPSKLHASSSFPLYGSIRGTGLVEELVSGSEASFFDICTSFILMFKRGKFEVDHS